MRIVRVIIATVLLVGCLGGAAFVAWETTVRGTSPSTTEDDRGSTSTTLPADADDVARAPIATTRNPFTPLVELPPTATTQPPP